MAFQSLLQKWRYPSIRFTSRLMSRPGCRRSVRPYHLLPTISQGREGRMGLRAGLSVPWDV